MAKRQRLKGAAWLGLGLLVAAACVAGVALLVRGFVAARNEAAAETEREQPVARAAPRCHQERRAGHHDRR